MRIACLGWGSLIWDPRELRVDENAWRGDGPMLPIEFARQSSRDRLTLVLLARGVRVQTLWNEMQVDRLGDARLNLAEREDSGRRQIGSWPSDQQHLHQADIGRWAAERALDAVVWTALGPKFNGEDNVVPTQEQVIIYLRGLVSAGRAANAEEYVRKTPRQVQTAYRAAIEHDLGWKPL